MVEVKALKDVTSDEVVAKAKEGLKWCEFASTADPDHIRGSGKFQLISVSEPSKKGRLHIFIEQYK